MVPACYGHQAKLRAVLFLVFLWGDSAARIIEFESGRIGDCVGVGVATSDGASMGTRYIHTSARIGTLLFGVKVIGSSRTSN